MSDILSLPPASDATLAEVEARFPAVALTLRHWDLLRARQGILRSMPDRDDIDPLNLAQSLEYLFLAEPVAPGVARLRLAGQHLTRLMGMETRGMPLCALFDGASRGEIAQAIDQVTGHGLRALLPVRAAGSLGRPGLEGLLALMPLGTGPGLPVRILGVLQTRGGIGRTPRRLTVSGPLRNLSPVAPVAPGLRPDTRPDTRPIARRPVLRVIPGGRA